MSDALTEQEMRAALSGPTTVSPAEAPAPQQSVEAARDKSALSLAASVKT